MPEQPQVDDRPEMPSWLSHALARGLLNRLPDRLVAALIRGGQRATYPTGSIVPGWEEGPWAAVVLSGSVRVFLPAFDGAQITLRYLKPGDVVGTFIGTRSGLVRSLQACEPVELLHLDAARLAALTQAEPKLAWEMLLAAARVSRLTHRSYGIRTFGSIRLRVANALLERALAGGSAVAGTVVPGTQHDLAIAAGTVREVVATALQGLKRDGIVAIRRGSVVILNPEALWREADGGFGFGSPD